MNSLLAVLIGMMALTVRVDSVEPDPTKVVYKCLKETGATKDDSENFFFGNTPNFSTEPQKCFAGCLYESYGVLVGGSISETGFQNYILANFDEEVQSALTSCAAEVADLGEDRCVTGPALRNCVAKIYE